MIKKDDVFEITKNKIVSKMDCILKIDTSEYRDYEISETNETITVPGFLDFYIPEKGDYFNFFVNYYVTIKKPENYKENDINDDEVITFNFKKNDVIIEQQYYQDQSNIQFITRLFNGKVEYIKNPELVVNQLHGVFSQLDLVHIELIVSNSMRCINDNDIKCRNSGDYSNNVFLSQVAQSKNNSWLSSISQREIKTSIVDAVIKNKVAKMNPIEKIINEKYDEL